MSGALCETVRAPFVSIHYFPPLFSNPAIGPYFREFPGSRPYFRVFPRPPPPPGGDWISLSETKSPKFFACGGLFDTCGFVLHADTCTYMLSAWSAFRSILISIYSDSTIISSGPPQAENFYGLIPLFPFRKHVF